MSEHRLSNEGTCQRCGFHTGRDEPQACVVRVVYIPSKRSVLDIIMPNGVTMYGRKTLAQIQFDEATDAQIVTAEEGYKLQCEAYRTPVSVITEERFDYALNVLPPCRWSRFGRFEHFHISERIVGNIVSWFICFRGDAGSRFFTFDDYSTLTQVELMERVIEFAKAKVTDADEASQKIRAELASVGGAE